MDQHQTTLFYQFQAVNANNAAVRLHEQLKLDDAFQMYIIALNSLAVVQNCPLRAKTPPVALCEGLQRQFLPSCCITVGSLSQPLLINTDQLLFTGSCSTVHQSLIIHYNLGLVSLHLGEMRRAADLFDMIMITDMLQKSSAHPTFVLSLYYNMGRAIYASIDNSKPDDDGEDAAMTVLFLFSEAARIGKSFFGCSKTMLANVLAALGNVLTKRGDFVAAMLAIEDALKIYEQVGVATGVEVESSYALGAPTA